MMPTLPLEPTRCQACRRRLKTERAKLRGYGAVCWAKRGLRRPDLPGREAFEPWHALAIPLFPECFPEVFHETP